MHAAAVDLGATSGRIVLGDLRPDGLHAEVVTRFPTLSSVRDGALRWHIDEIRDDVLAGLSTAAQRVRLASVGVDSWAVDYGLVDAELKLLAAPRHYRDPAHRAGYRLLFDGDDRDDVRSEVYARSGIAFQPFNTLVQLRCEPPRRLAAAQHLLLIPDLFAAWLCGHVGAELTNASTTQLLDARTRTWSPELLARAGVPNRLLPPLLEPGTRLGSADRVGLPATQVVAVGSHDTASAVAGAPLHHGEAYLSCGTWGLVGVERAGPVLTEDARRRGVTNEIGLGGRIRLLKNVTGLYLLERCFAAWRSDGVGGSTSQLLAAAADVRTLALVDPDDAALHGSDAPTAIRSACAAAAHPLPAGRAAVVRCVLQSLVAAWVRALDDVVAVHGAPVTLVRMVGGGAAIDLLAQLVADACGLPVSAGPVEATAIGNLLAQGISAGVWSDLDGARAAVRASQPVRTFRPRLSR